MRLLYIFMFALFLALAIWHLVQWQELSFIIIYLYVAFSSILAHYGYLQKLPLIGGAVVFLLYFYRIMPSFSQDWLAFTRGWQAIGLLLSALWLIALLIDGYLQEKKAASADDRSLRK